MFIIAVDAGSGSDWTAFSSVVTAVMAVITAVSLIYTFRVQRMTIKAMKLESDERLLQRGHQARQVYVDVSQIGEQVPAWNPDADHGKKPEIEVRRLTVKVSNTSDQRIRQVRLLSEYRVLPRVYLRADPIEEHELRQLNVDHPAFSRESSRTLVKTGKGELVSFDFDDDYTLLLSDIGSGESVEVVLSVEAIGSAVALPQISVAFSDDNGRSFRVDKYGNINELGGQ